MAKLDRSEKRHLHLTRYNRALIDELIIFEIWPGYKVSTPRPSFARRPLFRTRDSESH